MRKLLIILALLILLVVPASAQLAGYNYSQSCSLSVAGQTNYQVRFDVFNGSGSSSGSTIYLNGHSLQWNNGLPNDIRFTDPSDNLLPYWIENTSVNSSYSLIWVNVTNTSQNVTVWYGSTTSTGTSNGNSTFLFYDHFNGTSIDTTYWNRWLAAGGGTTTVSNGELNVTGGETGNKYEAQGTKTMFSPPISVRTRMKYINLSMQASGAGFDDRTANGTFIGGGIDEAVIYSSGGAQSWRAYNNGTLTSASRSTDVTSYSVVGIDVYSNLVNYYINDAYSNSINSNVPTDPVGAMFFANNINSSVYSDWVVVKKFNLTEPTPNNWGAEQNLTVVTPVAQFTTNTTSGLSPLNVAFTDTSTNTPTSWLWQFGDGTANVTTQNTTHTFSSDGTYQVNLTATNGAGSNLSSNTAITASTLSIVPGFAYYQSVNLSVAGQTNYQVRFDVFNGTGTSSGRNIYLNNHAQQWTSGIPIDIQFANVSGNLQPFWVENVSTMINSTHSIVWVNVSNTSNNVYVWYGNATMASASNTTSGVVFPLFDHFDGALDETTRWTKSGASPSVSNSIITSTGSASTAYIISKSSFNNTNTSVRSYATTAHFGGSTYAEFTNYLKYSASSVEVIVFNCHPSASLTGKLVSEPGDHVSASLGGISSNVYAVYEMYRNSTNNIVSVDGANIRALPDNYPASTNSYQLRPYHTDVNAGSSVSVNWVLVRSYRQAGEPIPNTWGAETETPVVPAAQFTVNTSFTNASGFVNFTDQSSNTPTSWAWNFGFGANSTTQNVSKQYTENIGNVTRQYNTTLTATNAVGSGTIFAQNNITVYPVNITWVANVTNGTSPLWVNFTPTVTNGTVADGYFTWTSGAEYYNTGSGGIYTARFDTPGLYNITLNATTQPGTSYNWSTKTNYINVTAGAVTPVASFTSNVTGGIPLFNVLFTDTSTNTPTSWLWQFGDGTANNTSQNVTHTFNQWIGNTTGTYNVNLTATNAAGSNKTTNVVITAYPLLSNITSNVTSGTAPFTVQLNDTITNGTATTFLWNWSDGGTNVTTQNATHTYTTAETFSILSNISNAYSYNWTNKSNYITSGNQTWPTVNFTTNVSSGYPSFDVLFTDVSTNATSWNWSFGDGETSTTRNITHIYNKWIGNTSQSYNVNHSASNANGTVWKNVTANITAYPLAHTLTSNVSSGKPTLFVQFNTTFSNGTATAWNWSFGGTNYSSTRNATFSYPDVGVHSVRLNSSNAYSYAWTNNASMINVTALTPPVADFSANYTTGNPGATIAFTDLSTNAPNAWLWVYGDLTTNGTTKNVTHIYSNVGLYTVTLTASNADGSDSETKTNYINITASPISPTANFHANTTTGTVPKNIQFTDDSAGYPTAWYWDYGDSSSGTEQNPLHSYTTAGTYNVHMRATNANGTDWENKTAYIVLTDPTPTPTPTPTTPPTPHYSSGGTSQYFPTNTYSGIHMINATSNGIASGSFVGNVTNVSNDSATWFILGPSSGSYSYYTTAFTPDSSTGNFSFTQTGLPLMPGKLYYIRAASANGRSSEELYFTTGALSTSPINQTNYGQYFQNVQSNLSDPQQAISSVPLPIVDAFGGGSMGWALVFTIIFGTSFIILWIRQENIILPIMVACLGASVILYTIQADFVWIIFAVAAIGFGGAIYRIVRGTQT